MHLTLSYQQQFRSLWSLSSDTRPRSVHRTPTKGPRKGWESVGSSMNESLVGSWECLVRGCCRHRHILREGSCEKRWRFGRRCTSRLEFFIFYFVEHHHHYHAHIAAAAAFRVVVAMKDNCIFSSGYHDGSMDRSFFYLLNRQPLLDSRMLWNCVTLLLACIPFSRWIKSRCGTSKYNLLETTTKGWKARPT